MLDKTKGNIINLTHQVTVTTSIDLEGMPEHLKGTLLNLIKPHTQGKDYIKDIVVKHDEVLNLILAHVFNGAATDSGAVEAINGQNTWAEMSLQPILDDSDVRKLKDQYLKELASR